MRKEYATQPYQKLDEGFSNYFLPDGNGVVLYADNHSCKEYVRTGYNQKQKHIKKVDLDMFPDKYV